MGTEVIPHTTTPCFIKKIILDYIFEQQTLVVVVGTLSTQSGHIRQQFKRPLNQPPLPPSSHSKRMYRYNEPMYTKYGHQMKARTCMEEQENIIPIYRSEVVPNTLNPQWLSIHLSMDQLCGGDEDRDIILQMRVYSYLTQLRQRHGGGKLTYNSQLQKPVAGTEGYIIIEEVIIQRRWSFLEYVLGGLEMSLIVGIDFTTSNGDPRYDNSLHYHSNEVINDYIMAIRSVGGILEAYNNDNKYPVYGFGARLPPTYTLSSNCFSLKGNFFDPEVYGIDGIIEAYRKALQVTSLHGPTNLSEVIKTCRQWSLSSSECNVNSNGERISGGDSRQQQQQQKYFILLLITDGLIDDVQETIDEIVEASKETIPMSIIIVGLGDGVDFSQMDLLDSRGSTTLVSSKDGSSPDRDIVRFVPYREFKGMKV
ncbi:copine, putative [Perkinsus marinus ATCC 50983]|uniref:Copine, putative n=1 Tax=Perkinsus marinus (strain ATCC 50983 / TXsc) TaxID=423536 RepID=C5KNE6_PERM5|nr:copine, putative [Perkinsus marinus ATCC 50983]EER13961.1 copine, putative [Perkinsus marinus ATCC 50983]|eukprot:XP_002782166.1 copine, putative [Perkinsus marinus ATCC 50983]